MDKSRPKIRTLVVDDEPLARQNILALLKADPEVEVVGVCASGAEAVRAIRRLSPDLVFLNIQMPEMSGFDVLEKIEAGRLPAIVFVTAYDQYALRAFDVHALDYLLKPFDDARFEKALRQAKAHAELGEAARLGEKLLALLDERGGAARETRPREFVTRLMVRSAGRIFFLKTEEVDWIEAADYYVRLHLGKKSHLLRESMSELELKLDPEKFARIHRWAIVNLDRVRELRQLFNGDHAVVLEGGTELKLSRRRREQLQQLMRAAGDKP
jgi:two-component system LytT family response regulator